MKFLFRRILLPVLANALALFVVWYFRRDEGFTVTPGVYGFVMVGLLLGVLNTLVRPLLKLVSLPLIFLSLGIFLVVINAFILGTTEYFFNVLFPETFQIRFDVGEGLFAYLTAAVLLSFVNTVTHFLLVRK